MRGTPSLPLLPGPLWSGVVAPDKGPIYGLNKTKPLFEFTGFFLHLNCVFMLNWIARNRTVLASKLYTYAKLNYRKQNCFEVNSVYCPISWSCRIHRLHLCKGVRPSPNECPGYDTKQSDGKFQLMLKLWGMWGTPLVPLLPGLLWPGLVAPDRVLSMG